jgi:hypothetical protein
MPSKQGLALLVRMYVLRSGIVVYTNGLAKLAVTEERLDYNLVDSLAQLDYLQTSSPQAYILSNKGIDVASRPVVRTEISSCWSPGSARGKKIHLWREYVVGKYREHESACGLCRLAIENITPHPSVQECPDCRRVVIINRTD